MNQEMIIQDNQLRTTQESMKDGYEGMKKIRKKAIYINGLRKIELIEKIEKIKD